VTLPVQTSTPSAEAVANLIEREYPLAAPIGCRFWRKGMADTYRVQAAGDEYFLKISMAARRSRQDVEEEVRLLRHLLADDIGVCEPISAIDGRNVVSISALEGDRTAVLYRAARGVEGTTDLHRRELGRMVARMHRSADRLDPPYARDFLELEHVLDDNLAAIGRIMPHRSNDFVMIDRIAAYAKALVTASLAPRPPEHGTCHGDLHGGDVLYSAEARPTLFDFDSSGIGWRALDLAVFNGSVDWMDTSRESELLRRRQVGEFVDGYASVRTLTPGEAAVLQLDGAVHHIFLMGLVLRWWTIRDGWHWANDDFIDWHMKWFRAWHQTHAI
jgi:Ser/Thr protein kinase RdoA (MazF antagonist)